MLPKLFGGPVEPVLRPILAVTITGVTGQYAFFGFFALYALERLHMREASVGLLLLCATVFGMAAGFVLGRVSDAVGRRPLIVIGSALQAVLALPLALAPPSIPLAVAVVTLMSLAGPLRYGPIGALIADVIPEERREAAYAANRIAYNVAALAGPLLGAALVAVDWRVLHAGVALVFSLSLPAALRLPRPIARGSLTRRAFALGQFASRGFLVIFASSLAATVTYNSFETLFPISLTQSHGLAPSQWGVLFVINPIVVMLMQMRVTRWTSGLGQATRLAIALPVMGFAFLPLLVDANALVLVLIMLVFVTGEMLWAPTAEALVARLAPADGRGAYMSTLGIAGGAGAALTPALGLHVRAAAGDEAMWLLVATVSLVAGMLYVLASRTSQAEVPAPVPA